MITHHTLVQRQGYILSHWLVNGSFLLTESFCKKYLCSATSLWCTLVNPFVVVHPTHILMHPRVHREHRLKSAALVFPKLCAAEEAEVHRESFYVPTKPYAANLFGPRCIALGFNFSS